MFLKCYFKSLFFLKYAKSCAPGGTRTPNLWNRNPTFYPIELRAQDGKRGIIAKNSVLCLILNKYTEVRRNDKVISMTRILPVLAK